MCVYIFSIYSVIYHVVVDTFVYLPVYAPPANDLVVNLDNLGLTVTFREWQMSHMVVTKLVVQISEFLPLWVGTTFFALTPSVIVSKLTT